MQSHIHIFERWKANGVWYDVADNSAKPAATRLLHIPYRKTDCEKDFPHNPRFLKGNTQNI